MIILLNKIKKILGRFLPSSARTFHMKMQAMTDEIQALTSKHDRDMRELKSILQEINKSASSTNAITGDIQKTTGDIKTAAGNINITIGDIQKTTRETGNTAKEILWADVFSSTVYESDWLKNKAFSPGRYAIEYVFLYVL